MRETTTFRELIWAEGRVVGARLQNADGRLVEESAAVVVGADGMWSPVARAAGATTDIAHPSFTCGYYAYWAGVPTHGVEFYVRQGRDILVGRSKLLHESTSALRKMSVGLLVEGGELAFER